MTQVLCYTGIGFNTCWRPASCAARIVSYWRESFSQLHDAPYTPVRFHR